MPINIARGGWGDAVNTFLSRGGLHQVNTFPKRKMHFRTRIPWKTFGRCGLAQGIMEDVDLTEESNKSFFSFEESTSSMNPCAKVRLPSVFQGILVGKAHTGFTPEEASGPVRSMRKPSAQRRDPRNPRWNLMGPMWLFQMLVR